jgi:glycolate oxidase FAD binding subunit
VPPDSEREFVPTTQSELARFVRDNIAGAKRPLVPAGGRTALNYGRAVSDDALFLSTTRLAQVIDYPARDMTITVEAGIRIEELAERLHKEGQQLPIDVPQQNRATLGGAIACNVSGSRRYGYGTFRDYVIGISAVDGLGRLFSAGGRVVKNVAGYDLCKLLIGSVGTLGVITQVTLKLKPIPETTGLLWATYDTFYEIDDVLERLLKSAARPVLIDVLNVSAARDVAAECRRSLPVDKPVLILGVEGAEKDVAWQLSALTRELAPLGPDELFSLTQEESACIRSALTEFPTESDAPLSFKASALPSSAMELVRKATEAGVSLLAHAGNGIVHGHFPDEAGTPERAAELLGPLRTLAHASRGHVVVTQCAPAWADRLQLCDEETSATPLMRKLRETFDPHGLLNPGRIFATP